MKRKKKTACCSPERELADRPLLSGPQAGGLEGTFKTLANATRLRILHGLVRAGELCVSELAEVLEMKPQAVSNQLQRLADRGIVDPRRNGVQIYYRIVDPCVVSLLDRGWCLTEDARQRTFEQTETKGAAS